MESCKLLTVVKLKCKLLANYQPIFRNAHGSEREVTELRNILQSSGIFLSVFHLKAAVLLLYDHMLIM
jgi:hypothetical protein